VSRTASSPFLLTTVRSNSRIAKFHGTHALLTRVLAGSLNCAAYVAGIIEGALCAADFPSTVTTILPLCIYTFQPFILQVTAHNLPVAGGVDKTVFLIKFHATVIAREVSLSKAQ